MALQGASQVNYEGKRGMRLENMLTLKLGQVFTGFGIGCGIGIGVGRPLNLGAIPVLNEVMVAARGATDAFSAVQRPLNNALRKVGAKSIEAGIGCGVGFGHGFGFGIAVKPGVLHQIQSNIAVVAAHLMTKLGLGPNSSFSVGQQNFPHSNELVPNFASEENVIDGKTNRSEDPLTSEKYNTRAKAVLNNFLKDPILIEENSPFTEQTSSPLHLESVIKEMQVAIEELKNENKAIRRMVLDELQLSCDECFECRRRQRRRR